MNRDEREALHMALITGSIYITIDGELQLTSDVAAAEIRRLVEGLEYLSTRNSEPAWRMQEYARNLLEGNDGDS